VKNNTIDPNNLVLDSVVTIEFSMSEIDILLKTLLFAKQTATILYHAEKEKGSKEGSEKMRAVIKEADALHNIINTSVIIGEPESKDFH